VNLKELPLYVNQWLFMCGQFIYIFAENCVQKINEF